MNSVDKSAKVVDALAMFVVCFLSLLLLAYVGLGEGQRTYVGFLSSKMAAQGEIVQNAMAGHLKAGLPLRQFVGFQNLSTQISDSDRTVALIAATDRADKVVFTNQSAGDMGATGIDINRDGIQAAKLTVNERYEVHQSDNFISVVLPLKNKFESVGSLWVVMPKTVVSQAVSFAYVPVLSFIAVLSALFSWVIVWSKNTDETKRVRRQEVGLTVCFLLTSVVVISLLISLYSDGAQAKAKALASSLSERVGAISDSRVDLSDIDGIDKAFADYRVYNQDIESIGLLKNESYVIHTDAKKVGASWSPSPGTFEYKVALPNDPQGKSQAVTVALPVDVVYKAVGNSGKNFVVLFFASGFLAALVLQLANAVRKKVSSVGLSDGELASIALEKVKPVLFLAVFIDYLSASFLPQLIRGYADLAQAPPFMTSVAFMAYFSCFALILVPGGKFAQRHGPKPLIWGGALLVALALGLMVSTSNFTLIILARAMAGLGQGLVSIGVQTLILTAGDTGGNRTKNNGIIVYNFNAGMVSGMAIGSLLVLYMGTMGVFIFGLVAAIALFLFIVFVIPPLPAPAATGESEKSGGFFQTLRSFEFLRVMLLVGIPSKAVFTGVIIFGLPILLSKMAFATDEIGQIVMFYAVGVLIANYVVGNSKTVPLNRLLSAGMVIGCVGLIMIGGIGYMGSQWAQDNGLLVAIVLVLGVLSVGLGHGAVNAPVVSYVATTDIAARMGVISTTSLYRVLERVGHVIGPMIVGQLLLFSGQDPLVVGWIGAVLLGLFLLFQFGHRSSSTKSVHAK